MTKERPKLSDQVRQAIADAEVSRYWIWKETGVAQETLSRFMNRKGGLSLDGLDKIAEVLKLDLVRRRKGGKED